MTGNNKNWKETPPSITAIGFPPAGGCVILNAIISITAIPTARAIVIKLTSKNVIKIIYPSENGNFPHLRGFI